jgi:hypothetical protein
MTALEYASRDEAIERLPTLHGLPAVNISSFANGALGEHRRHDTDGMMLEIDAPGCRSSAVD